MRTVSIAALRRIVIAAQGYASRTRTGTRREVEDAVRALSCVQLDSITAVERSHRIALGSRVGAYPRETVSRLLGQGRIFEYWAHEACLIPVEEWPLFRSRMTRHHPWRGDVIAQHPELAEEVLAAIRERGPLTSRDFDGKGGGGMWNWKPAKMVLEALWNSGELVIAGRVSGFQRSYDLAERVLPREVLDAPVPDEATRDRELDTAGGAGARRAHRRGDRRALAHARRGGAHPPHRRRARRRRRPRARPRRGRRTRTYSSSRAPTSTLRARPRRPSSRPSTTSSGTGRSRAASSASTTSSRSTSAPTSAVRLLRPAVPLARPHRRTRRPEVRARRRHARREGAPSRAGRPPSAALDDAFERALDRLRRTIGLERVRR